MALERPHEAEQIAQHLERERVARRDRLVDFGVTMLQIVFWVCAGLALMGLSLHSTSEDVGRIWWLAGQTVWLAGVLFTLLASYRRGVRRGDW